MAVRWAAGGVSVVVLVVLALTHVTLGLSSVKEGEKCSLDSGIVQNVPDYSETLENSYSLTLEMTSPNDYTTVYVKEVHERRKYHEKAVNVVGMSMEINGSSVVYQYYPDKQVLVETLNGSCHEMGQSPTFPWGWQIPAEELGYENFGVASILQLASKLTTKLLSSQTNDDGVTVDVYKACAANDDVELFFHYSKPPWLMPEGSLFSGNEASLPIMIQVQYVDGFESWKYTVVDFVPYVNSHSLLEPPRGMSCEAIVGILTDEPVPTIPNHFSLAEEAVVNSVIDGVDYGKQYLEKVQVTYAGEISLVSLLVTLPYDNSAGTAFAIKVIHDFNTGVQYTLLKEYGNCSMDPIPPFAFDEHFGGFLGSGDTLLSANQMFHLDENYAFVGERDSRSILGDLWTSTRLDDIPNSAMGGMQNFEKAVVEYYFSQGLEEKPSGDKVVTNLPFRGDLFVYNKSNLEQIVATVTTNFYDFSVVELFSPDEFSVEECYERFDDDWSYLDIFFPAKKSNQQAAAIEEQTLFKHEVMLKLIEIGRLSPVRIASIDVQAGDSGVMPNTSNADMIIAKVKLLERAPYIFSYRQPPDETLPKPGKNEKMVPNIRTREDCATICHDETTMTCKSFHHCDGNVCYLSKLEGPDGDIDESTEMACEHWVYDLVNQTLEDYPSEMVYKQVANAVKNGDFIFQLPYKNNTVQVGYEASLSLHYRTPDPMDAVRWQFTLEATHMTVEHADDNVTVADLTECMVLCLGWLSYRCETIIHQTDEKLCLLLSRHYHELNHTELVPKTNSFVHARSYLVDYSPIFGGVSLNSTGPVYSPVEHLEMCARICSQESSIDCQSFEYCPSSQMCHLHEEHYLDVIEDGDYTTGTKCVHFSRKTDDSFTKYADQGLAPSQHTLEAILTSSMACAKMCMEDEDVLCQSFDFCAKCNDATVDVCGEDNNGVVGACFLATHHLGESGLKLKTAKGCDHYDRDTFGNQDYASWVASRKKSDNPYTPGDMTGLAFGMIFLGILLTIGFLFAITRFRPTAVPKDLELSFQKLKTSGESDI